jgi:hypothetical protein
VTFQLNLEQPFRTDLDYYRERANGIASVTGVSAAEARRDLAAQSGQREAVTVLLELGADPLIQDNLHGGNALGWAREGGHEDLADVLP